MLPRLQPLHRPAACVVVVLLLVSCGPHVTRVTAQPEPLYVTDTREPVRLTVGVTYQRFEDDARMIEEVSVPLSLRVPLGGGFGASLLAGGASAGGDAWERVHGLADVQVGLSYRRGVGGGSVVATLGANLPSGKRDLTPEEFATSVALSQNFFSFAQPGFGQGFNLSPGLTVAYPLGDRLAVGGGAAYQIKGAYSPLTTLEADYDPGDELMLTLGADLRVGRTAALSADVAYARYGRDELGDESFYQAGDRLAVSFQYLAHFGFDELHVYGRYSTREEGEVPALDGGFVPEAQRAVPSYGRLRVLYRKRTTDATSLGLLVQGRRYQETATFDQKTLVDVGLRPELRLTRQVSLVSRFAYTFGSFDGPTAGAGLSVRL